MSDTLFFVIGLLAGLAISFAAVDLVRHVWLRRWFPRSGGAFLVELLHATGERSKTYVDPSSEQSIRDLLDRAEPIDDVDVVVIIEADKRQREQYAHSA